MADNPYVGDPAQGNSAGAGSNEYTSSAAQGGGGAAAPNAPQEGRTASSEWGGPTAQDTARSEPGAIANYRPGAHAS